MTILSILMLAVCSYTDLRCRLISKYVLAVFLASVLGLMVCVYIFGNRFIFINGCLLYDLKAENIICALIPGIILFVISILTGEAIGRGDVYVIGLLGLMIGFDGIFAVLFVSMISCALFGIIYMAVTGKGRKETLPYIPFLLGAYLVILFLNYSTGT